MSPSGSLVTGKGSGGRYWPSGSRVAWRYPQRRKMSKIASRSCTPAADGAVSVSALLAIASSLQISVWREKIDFRGYFYARPFGGLASRFGRGIDETHGIR